jgi:hypothetical protein
LLFAAALSVGFVAPAVAVDINFGPHDCQPVSFTAPSQQYPLTYATNGVTNGGTGTNYMIACNIPRSPLGAGMTAGSFYIDGDNPPGLFTVCSILSWDFTGAFLGGVGVDMQAPGAYDKLVTLPASQLGMWAYPFIICTLPPGGTLRGVTSIQ